MLATPRQREEDMAEAATTNDNQYLTFTLERELFALDIA